MSKSSVCEIYRSSILESHSIPEVKYPETESSDNEINK
jgi:hypothetical protein